MSDYDPAMRSARAIMVAGAIAGVCMLGCEPSVDRGQSKRPPPPRVEEKPPQAAFGSIPEGGSKSTLGKARDSAVRLKDKMEARDAEIGKMADDIFKAK